MGVELVNLGDLEYEKSFEGGVRFATDWADISRRLGGRKLGVGHWIVPPGKASVPYHAHLVNEEMVLVLGGEIRVRLNDRVYPLAAGDLVALPPGPDSVHQLLNHSSSGPTRPPTSGASRSTSRWPSPPIRPPSAIRGS